MLPSPDDPTRDETITGGVMKSCRFCRRGVMISSPNKQNVDLQEIDKNVGNAERLPRTTRKVTALTPYEEDLVETIVQAFADEKSRDAFRIIIGKLGSNISYHLMRCALEKRDLAVSHGAYFIGMAKMVAKEQGVDLGFKCRGPA
jgi:hypothetical protein